MNILDLLRNVGAWIRVVLTAAVTWLVVAESILVVFADEIAPLIPAPWGDQVSAFILAVIAVVSAAVAIIRRVTPVLPTKRGILP